MESIDHKFISGNRENEGYPGYGRKIKLKVLNQISKSICKIAIIKENEKYNSTGTGFFMHYQPEKDLNILVTNYHNISQDMVDSKSTIIIQIENGREMKLTLDSNNRFIKCFQIPDIIIIEMKDSDEIYNDIIFLYYDLNYQFGYKQYSDADIFILQHPLGEDTDVGIGKILNIDDFEFEHSIETDYGSSGSPVILNGNLKIIGIHKQRNKINDSGIGTFIGEIFKHKLDLHNKEIDKRNKILTKFINRKIKINWLMLYNYFNNWKKKMYSIIHEEEMKKRISLLEKSNELTRISYEEEKILESKNLDKLKIKSKK